MPGLYSSKRRVIVAIACAGFAGLAAAELIEVKLTPGTLVEKQLTVASGKFAELCATLHKGRNVSWQFRADAEIDFNIHYHVDKRVEYPEKRAAINSASGRLVAEVDQTYCWMWINRSGTPIAVRVALEETRH